MTFETDKEAKMKKSKNFHIEQKSKIMKFVFSVIFFVGIGIKIQFKFIKQDL